MHDDDDDNDHLAAHGEAIREYAANAGSERLEQAWILTPWDVWQRNPHYQGPPVRHPEDDFGPQIG